MSYLMKASAYYGRTTPGWVAVVHGYPWHFTGRTGKKEAEAALNHINK